MQRTVKKIWNTVTTILIGLVVLLAALLWGGRLMGIEALVVQSGSMEPELPVGALIYVKPTAPEALQPGDVITFELGGGIRGTHRILRVLKESGALSFVTKGDANEAEDSNPVSQEALVGKVVFHIPLLGFLVARIQTPPGLYLAAAVLALLLLLTLLPDILFPEKKK